ncbi:EAL domain-containing protein [Aquihabitans sp. McL0605]|uniref:EAL domain-containing protein n=1 Tax=Aquihabitans sp. McL0605 TaxID=3415671 RepID=UPI003CEE1A9C
MILLAIGFVASTAAAVLGPTAQIVVALPIGFGAVILGLIIAQRSPDHVRATWRLFALGGAGCIIASIVQAFSESLGIDTFPGPSHLIYAVSYGTLIVATYRMGNIRASNGNLAAHLDGLIMAIGASTVVWALVLWPYMADTSHPRNEQLVNVGFSVLTMMLLAATTRLAVGPGVRSASYYMLAAAVGLVFVTDVGATLSSVNGIRSGVSLLLTPFIYTLFAAVSIHPEMPYLFEPPSERVHLLTQKRLVLLGAGLLVVPVMIAWSEVADRPIDLPILAIGAAAMAVVVLMRFRLLVKAQEEAVQIQQIQREANADLAAASSRHAMHRATLRAVMRLAGEQPDMRVSITQAVGDSLRVLDAVGQDAEAAVGSSIAMDAIPEALLQGLNDRTLSTVEGAAPIDLSAAASGGATACVLVAPLSSQHDLNGALILTSRRPASVTLIQSVETLASTVSLALESAVLTENLLRRRSERRFRALVENSSDIVLVVDSERQITFASPAAHRLLGLSEKSLLATHPARWVHADDWPVLARVLDGTSSQQHSETDSVEVRIRHIDGSHRWFEIRTRDLEHDPEIQGLVVTARGISDRKATEKQLAESEARFRALVQSSSDVVAVVLDNGCFSYVSPAISEMLGYSPEELDGTPAIALVAPDEVATFATTYPELSQRRLPSGDLTTRRIETQLRHRSGELRTVDITVSDMRDDPAVGGIVLNARDITVRKALEADLRFQALHDTLTGLANRTMFTQQTASALRSGKGVESVGALFIDLDDFKTVNDSLGHAVGDQLLQEVSTRLVTSLSSEDLAARLGGDEFAVLVVDAPDQTGVVALAERVLALVAQPYRIQGRDIRVTASIGIAFADDEGVDAEVLLRSADVAMYLAKDRGKNRYAVFEAHMHTSVFERLELKADLVRAIDDGQLRCHYQPIVSLQTGRISGVEALVRWEHPTRGLLSPDAFIPLAEDTGLIVPLGRWVMREACQQLRAWQLRLPARSTLSMSINLSVRQLMHEQIIRDVREAIDDAGLDPSTITLEITETTLMHDTEMTRERLAELRRIGVSLAVDDFGTGYSSLQYVQRFPIDIIKIDRSFVTGLGTNPGDGAVVQSMIELSQRLGVHTVAEGIDRPEQVTLLQSLGADLGQGYLFSKPVEASKISDLLDSSPHENPRFLLH